MSDLDLDVDNYSEQELFSIIKYTGDYNEASKESIQSQVNKMITTSIQKYKSDPIVETLIPFLNNVGNKLLSYIEIRAPVQYAPTNYNILQSQNQVSGGDHSVTTDKIVPVLNVNNYDFPAGVINPIERRTIRKVVSIDSIFRENYATTPSSDFTWYLPDKEQKVVSIKLVSLELPIMWYSISEKNKSNTFKIKTYNIKGKPDKTHIIDMPSGNYMAGDFGIALTNYMLNKGEGLEYIVCNVNPITTKTIFRARDKSDGGDCIYDVNKPYYSPKFYFSIDFGENITTSCNVITNTKKMHQKNNENRYSQYCLGSFMGFTKRYYDIKRDDKHIDYVHDGSKILEFECYLESESSYGNGRNNYIFISIDDYNNNYISESIIASSVNNYLGPNILGRISINENFSAVMMNTSADKIFKQRDYMGPVNLTKFHIKLLDKYGNVIDINNNDFSMALELTILYT